MANYDLLHSTTLTVGSTTSLTIGSIAGTYRDLILVMYLQGTNSNRINGIVNGDSASDKYRMVSVENDGGTGLSDSTGAGTNAYFHAGVCTNNTWSVNTVNFMDYSSTVRQKTFLSHEGVGTSRTGLRAMTWRDDDAITSITVSTSTGNFDAGCTFKLFGIEA